MVVPVDGSSPEVALWVIAVMGARLLPIAVLAPVAGGHWPGSGVRLALGATLALALVAGATPGRLSTVAASVVGWSNEERALALAVELARGLVLGLALAFALAAIRAGLRLAGLAAFGLGPERAAPSVAELFALLPVALLFAFDGHLLVLRALAADYRHWPMAGASGWTFELVPAWSVASPRIVAAAIAESGAVMTVAVAIAAPLVVSSVLARLVLGLVQAVHSRLITPAEHRALAWLVGAFVLVVALPAMVAVALASLARLG